MNQLFLMIYFLKISHYNRSAQAFFKDKISRDLSITVLFCAFFVWAIMRLQREHEWGILSSIYVYFVQFGVSGACCN